MGWKGIATFVFLLLLLEFLCDISSLFNVSYCFPFIFKLLYWYLRWLDWIFLGGYLPSLSLNYVGMSKDMEKRLPQLYYIKMKISYDLGFIATGVAMAT